MNNKVINFLRIFIATVIFFVLMFVLYKEFAGKKSNKNSNDSVTVVNETAESESMNSDSSSGSTMEEKDSEETIYKSNHFNNSWYNPNIYRALCTSVTDDYFDRICFFGDSRTKGLLEYSGLSVYHGFYKVGTTAAAACIEREYTDDYYYYGNILDMIERVDYDIYYIAYGTNDLGLGNSEQFINNMKVIVDHIKEYHPDAIIYIENILPMSYNFSINHPTFSNENAQEYNGALLQMCMDYDDLIYLDVASCMKKYDNSALDEYMADGLHYNNEGYKIIVDFIKSTVVEKREHAK